MNILSIIPRKLPADILEGMCDIHSHILCGVDDGVKDFDSSVLALQYFESKGVKHMTLTPHFMTGVNNDRTSIEAKFHKFKSDCSAKTGIQLGIAAEYMMDNLFAERLEKGDILYLDTKADKILVETSYFNPPFGLMQTLNEIKSKGFYPVLAHPERYMYMHDEAYYNNLKQKGILFQLNIGSVCGVYGKTAQQKALMLLKKDFYNYKGSDLHGMDLLQMIKSSKIPEGLRLGYED